MTTEDIGARARPLRRRRPRRVQGLAGGRGAQEPAPPRGRRVRAALAWDAERHESSGSGTATAERACCSTNAALMRPRGRRDTLLPAGHAEGCADTFRELYRAVYAAVAAGAPPPSRPTRPSPTATATTCSATPSPSPTPRDAGSEVTAMKLGLLTAASPDTGWNGSPTWAVGERLRDARGRLLASVGRRARRYAGVSHIDVAEARRGRSVHATSSRGRAGDLALAYYPNTSMPTRASARDATRTSGR